MTILPYIPSLPYSFFFLVNDPAPTEFYPFPLHDALPILILYRLLVRTVTPLTATDNSELPLTGLRFACPDHSPSAPAASGQGTRIANPSVAVPNCPFLPSEDHPSQLHPPFNLPSPLLLHK